MRSRAREERPSAPFWVTLGVVPLCAVGVTIYALVWYANTWNDIADAAFVAALAAGLFSGILHAALNRRFTAAAVVAVAATLLTIGLFFVAYVIWISESCRNPTRCFS